MLAQYLFSRLIFSQRAGSLIRRIAWLSVVATAVSVTAFLIVLFVMNGMNHSIRQRILALEPHLVIQVKNFSESLKLETLPIYQRLKEDPKNQVSVFESQDVIIRTLDGQFRGAQARGLSKESFLLLIHQLQTLDEDKSKKKSLEVPSWSEAEIPGEAEVVIGLDLAKSLNVFEGDELTFVPPESLLLPVGEAPKFDKVRVRRIVSTNLSDLDSQMVFYLKGSALKNFRDTASKIQGFEVWLSDGEMADEQKEALLNFSDVQIQSWKERNSALFYALKLEKTMIGVFLGLAGLISSFSILTVMALLVTQKKTDIAMLRALGLSNKDVTRLLVQVGLLLGGSGTLVGVILGTGVSLWLQYFPITGVLPEIYYDQAIPSLVDWTLVFFVLAVSFLVSGFGSFFPARGMSEMSPSAALRQKN